MIKKKLIGSTIFKKGFGTFIIEEGKEDFYKSIGLDIFEDEPNKTKKGTRNRKRSVNTDGENNDK